MRTSDRILIGLAGLFLILMPLQFFFAGLGVFGGNFDTHEAFGAGLLHLLTLLMTIVALVAKRWNYAGLSFGLFFLFFVQIAMVSFGRDADATWISALHPFLAFTYWPYVYFLIWSPLRQQVQTQQQLAVGEPAASEGMQPA